MVGLGKLHIFNGLLRQWFEHSSLILSNKNPQLIKPGTIVFNRGTTLIVLKKKWEPLDCFKDSGSDIQSLFHRWALSFSAKLSVRFLGKVYFGFRHSLFYEVLTV